jgi:diguanylate cyclase (GGDEF)-like protein/PAS domain S-box-containing protein
MIFDIQTLAFISYLTFFIQFIALFGQYIVNRTFKGVQWWLLGSTLWSVGVIFMPMVSINSLLILAMLANPLVVLGHIFLFVGMIRFLDQKENRWGLTSIYVVFILSYYYFIFANNDLSARTFIVSSALGLISFMTTFNLVIHKDRLISGSAIFTAIVFFAYGCFSLFRVFAVLFSPPMQTYSDQTLNLQLSFIITIIASLLWTFGFIIMQNQRLSSEIREEKEKLQKIFNVSPDGAIISRLSDGLIVEVNAGFLVMSGYTRAEVIENSTININIWHQVADREAFVKELEDKGYCENLEFVFQRKNGSLLTGNVSAKILTIQTISHIVSVVHDITQSKAAEEAIRESEELYHSILNASPDDITITDLRGSILVISPAARKMFGYEPEYDQFYGSQIIDYIVPEDRERAKLNIISMCQGKPTGPNEYHGVRKNGTIFDIEVKSGVIQGANRQPTKMVFIIRDITERKQAEQQIQQLVEQLEIEKKTAEFNAITDSLTELANRRYFDEALNTQFHRLKRSLSSMSLIMLDVDHFKKYNDCYGHVAGDECLRQIGATLKTVVGRATDIVARYGGEEFVVILTETGQNGAVTLAERIRKAVEALAIPHSGSDISEYITVSLGVTTVYPATRLASAEKVVGLADDALYSTKKAGRNRIFMITEAAILDTTLKIDCLGEYRDVKLV